MTLRAGLPGPAAVRSGDQVSRSGLRARASPRPLQPSAASQAAGSSRHSSAPAGSRFAAESSRAKGMSWSITTGPRFSRPAVFSTAASGRRSASSAGVLPLDGPPTSACHRIMGSCQVSVTCATTPAPQTPATDASSACTM